MANWCNNWVSLDGEPEKVKAFMDDVKALEKECIETDLGVHPCDDGEYMFEFYLDEDSFSFSSKWSPANESLEFLAKKHSVEVVNRYEECAMGIYGEWKNDGKVSTDIFLEDSDFDLFSEDDESGMYLFEGEWYECREEILEVILDRKIKASLASHL